MIIIKVIKKINNNVVFVLNNNNEEIIAVGKGLGFGKIPYELKDESLIERIYVNLNHNDAIKTFGQLPLQDIILTEEVIKEGKKILDKNINENILLTLSDHISFMLDRYNEGLDIKSPLEWQIKHLYPKEIQVGKYAVEIINKKKNISLPESEAAHIALHFINSQMITNSISDTSKLTDIMGDIISIIKYFYKCEFDENSLNFSRFINHLQYFILRHMQGIKINDGNQELYLEMKKRYENEVRCINRIEEFLYKNFNWTCNEDEKLYLVLHLQRLITRENK